MLSKMFNKPFYVFCQSFKFSKECVIDPFNANKAVERVLERPYGEDFMIDLKFDLTPMDCISLVFIFN